MSCKRGFILFICFAMIAFPITSFADSALSQTTAEQGISHEENNIHSSDRPSNISENTNNYPIDTLHETYQKESKYRSVSAVGSPIQKEIHDRRILIQTKPGMTLPIEKWGVERIATPPMFDVEGLMVVRVPDTMDFDKKLHMIQNDTRVAIAEPDLIREVSQVQFTSWDACNWHLQKINISQAWNITQGSDQVTIAVLDSGVNSDHPDLAGRVLPGYDFVNRDHDPADDHGHGTFVSGIIAANAGGTHQRVRGIDSNVNILPVKITNSNGKISSHHIILGIRYAIEQGADILNMSFGSYRYSEVEARAIKEAHDAGLILIAAAGNDGSNELFYPASYPEVISVSASGETDTLADFSNYGNFIDLAAPGENMCSTSFNGGYEVGSGTSFAAPIVSGMASLLKAANPDWTNTEVEWALEASADQINNQARWSNDIGYGRINAWDAINTTIPSWSDDVSNEKASAKRLKDTDSIETNLYYPSDIDWYHLSLEQGDMVEFTIHNTSDILDLILVIHSPDGDEQIVDNKDMGDGEGVAFEAEQGDYYFGIYDYYSHWSDLPYQLTVNVDRAEKEIPTDPGVPEEPTKSDEVVSKFPDVRQYIEEINFLTEQGIIKGFPDGTFQPERNVTRLQAVTMILNEMGIDFEQAVALNPGLKDMSPGVYGYEAVAKAVELGFIKGKDNGKFEPHAPLTRAQMAAILVKAYDLTGASHTEFIDVPKNHYAYGIINTLVANGISRGYPDQKYRPNEQVSRQHFSVFLYNYLQRK